MVSAIVLIVLISIHSTSKFSRGYFEYVNLVVKERSASIANDVSEIIDVAEILPPSSFVKHATNMPSLRSKSVVIDIEDTDEDIVKDTATLEKYSNKKVPDSIEDNLHDNRTAPTDGHDVPSLQSKLVPIAIEDTTTLDKHPNETIPASIKDNFHDNRIAPTDYNDGVTKDDSATFKHDIDHYRDDRRAIVIISTGEKAAKSSLVERFVWTARTIGNYTGYIILITDANETRYANFTVAAHPQFTQSSGLVTTSNQDPNVRNRFLVYQTEERRFKATTKFKKFKALTMNSKVFKTYILQYIDADYRLDAVELFYYLDVDIVIGNSMQPFFEKLEEQYNIGRHASDFSRRQKTSKIYFFEGNGSFDIQGGQIVLDRSNSQPCLTRWRKLMQDDRKNKFQKDQYSLMQMLMEQRERANTTASNLKDIQRHKDCEIVLMKQDKSMIRFPDLGDIAERTAEMRKDQELGRPHVRPDYPTLVHFRNSARVIRKVEGSSLELYLRDVMRFEDNQTDVLGILNKNKMDIGKQKAYKPPTR